jgi:hypothetical protein
MRYMYMYRLLQYNAGAPVPIKLYYFVFAAFSRDPRQRYVPGVLGTTKPNH